MHELDEPGVANGGRLVERVLPHHVGGGQQEEIRLRLALVGRATLVGGDAPEAGVLHVEHHVQVVPTEGFEPALTAF